MDIINNKVGKHHITVLVLFLANLLRIVSIMKS
jgi:hypothetical protein